MKMSRRAKRMEQHYKRSKGDPGLNIVSLMDIFTLLVFFLLISSGEVENMTSNKAIKLPESIAKDKPRETSVIVVSNDEILFQGEKIANVSDIAVSEQEVIAPLVTALENLSARSLVAVDTTPALGQPAAEREVTIMGDRDIPFKLLKKIMASCTAAKYDHISLAVLNKSSTGE